MTHALSQVPITSPEGAAIRVDQDLGFLAIAVTIHVTEDSEIQNTWSNESGEWKRVIPEEVMPDSGKLLLRAQSEVFRCRQLKGDFTTLLALRGIQAELNIRLRAEMSQ